MSFPRHPFLIAVLLVFGQGTSTTVEAQPDLQGWSVLVRSMERSAWVSDLEMLEPGSVLGGLEPTLDPSRFRPRTDWGQQLIGQLEALPLAAHHADRALQQLLADSMLNFRLTQAAADRYRPLVEQSLTGAGLPGDWALLPMALTGWDMAYYGPGRRAGPWGLDLVSALSLGLDIRRGWDDRHRHQSMTAAAVQHAAAATAAFPEDPLRQVLAFVRGPESADAFRPEELDAGLLEWLHLLRVLLQVDRNFDRDDTHALWRLREGQMSLVGCPDGGGPLYFSLFPGGDAAVLALREENPWFTTDSVGFTGDVGQLFVPLSWGPIIEAEGVPCGERPDARRPAPIVRHTVQPGEVLGSVARDYGVRIADIKAHNGLTSDVIRIGQTLEIPGGRQRQGPPTAPPTPAAPVGADTPWVWHTVLEGESYWSIAQQYPQAGTEDLLRMNDTAPEDLRPGMKLRIPPP